MALMSPIALFLQVFSDQGIVGAGYKIFTYVAGSTTPVTTYTDSTLGVQNANPIVMQANGRLPASVWAPAGTVIKMVLADPTGAPIANGTIDNIPMLNENPATAPYYAITTAEQAAGVTPTDYSYEPSPIIDVRRYGFAAANSAAVNAACIRTAILVAVALNGATIQLPPGAYNVGAATDVINIPESVWVLGIGTGGTRLTSASDGSGGGLFRLGGAMSGVLKYDCALGNMSIVLTNVAGKAVDCVETVAAQVHDMYLEGPINAVRSTEGVRIDGGNVSSFFNIIKNVQCNHMHKSFHMVKTTGTIETTQNIFMSCEALGDVATDTTSIGLLVDNGQGSGSMWIGGNMESCKYGFEFISGCQSMTVHGARIEGCTKDVHFQATAGAQSFMGCFLDVNNIQDDSAVQYHRFLGCVNGSNLNADEYDPGSKIKRATVTGQTPLILEGFPGDTTTEQFIIRNSAGQKLFSVTNQGKIARINNNAPASVTGAKAGNAALISLLPVLAATGLIVDNTT